MQAKFITFEGGEGTGKSTQTRALARRLFDHKIACTVTREPGGSPFAERVRDLLLSRDTPDHDALAETMLFYGARADHLAKTIRPALAQGRWVICDRFSDSTRVYQGVAGGIEPSKIATLDELVVGETVPDLTIILDLPAREGMARATTRRAEGAAAAIDSFEARDMDFHDKLRQGFMHLAESEPKRCVLIDAGGSVDEIAASIWAQVETRLFQGAVARDDQ